MLKAALVDVGGTLWPDRPTGHVSDQPCLEALAKLLPGLPPAEALSALRAALGAENDSPVQQTHATVAKAVRQLGLRCTEAQAIEVRRALCTRARPDLELFAGAETFLERIRELGLRCVVVSNVQVRGADEYWRDFEDFGIAHLIDAIVTSLEVGFRKPHPAIFRRAVQEARCQPGDCVMVGDNELKDIHPANALGMRTIRVAIEQPPTASAADVLVTNLTEAADALAAVTGFTAGALFEE